MSNEFWNSPTYKIVQAMKATGNQPGLIQQWKEAVEHWAQRNAKTPEGAALLAWLPQWRVRPFYSATELAPIFPALAVTLRITSTLRLAPSANRLAHELDYAGLPSLKFPDPFGNRLFICERVHFWRKYPLTADELKEIYYGAA